MSRACAFVCTARILVNAHWLSDTLGAITLVTLVAWLLSVLVRPRLSHR
jgi:membrane-associated phospholipid phosphatase